MKTPAVLTDLTPEQEEKLNGGYNYRRPVRRITPGTWNAFN
ncbi:hypothetical protein [Gloeocapsa sp. PCC 73106]|nr:hypothetical protein [Gloeocapsa sp. PCC 73106]ELS00124.1 hypothetical protein GLO73106DRAFT_00039790 [Gloeocapsa sp. PCC 73106]